VFYVNLDVIYEVGGGGGDGGRGCEYIIRSTDFAGRRESGDPPSWIAY
jgi:hypothetical protein